MPDKPRPDEAFIQEIGQSGKIEEFCQNNYEDNVEQCQMMIADKLVGGEQPQDTGPQPAEPSPEPQGPPQEAPDEGDPVNETIGSPDGSIETLVADCVGSGFLGLHRPNTEACMRAVAMHERERR